MRPFSVSEILAVIRGSCIETTVAHHDSMVKMVFELEFVSEVHATPYGPGTELNTAAAATDGHRTINMRIDGVEVDLSVQGRIDIDTVPDYSGMRGAGTPKRRGRYHAEAVFLKINVGIESEQRRQERTTALNGTIVQPVQLVPFGVIFLGGYRIR